MTLAENTGGIKKVIYDLGANNGDDVDYYLKKADIVVAVEANPVLCEQMRKRFKSEIKRQQLVIENCVLTVDEENVSVPFYIHKDAHTLSQFPVPQKPENFEEVLLPAKTVSQLFSKYGYPYYVKVDLEGYDHIILRTLFENGIFPDYISAESHHIMVFALLATFGGYDQFKVIDGRSVEKTIVIG
jgi:FkbM family methyltransferase